MAREDQNIIRDGYGYAEAIIDAADEVLDMGRFHKCEGERKLVGFTARVLAKVFDLDANEVCDDLSDMVDLKYDQRNVWRGR